MPNHEEKGKENLRGDLPWPSLFHTFPPGRCVCIDQSVRAAHQQLFETKKDEQCVAHCSREQDRKKLMTIYLVFFKKNKSTVDSGKNVRENKCKYGDCNELQGN
jgi:hypothetical protein